MPADKAPDRTAAFKPGDIIAPGTGTRVLVRWSADTIQTIRDDPAVSDWLKQAIVDLARRDPLDALNDVELLTALVTDRWEALIRASRPEQVRTHDG